MRVFSKFALLAGQLISMTRGIDHLARPGYDGGPSVCAIKIRRNGFLAINHLHLLLLTGAR